MPRVRAATIAVRPASHSSQMPRGTLPTSASSSVMAPPSASQPAMPATDLECATTTATPVSSQTSGSMMNSASP